MTKKPKYAGLGIALGAGLGVAVGVSLGHIALWLGLGVAIGMALGATLRRKELACPECVEIHRAHEVRNLRQQN